MKTLRLLATALLATWALVAAATPPLPLASLTVYSEQGQPFGFVLDGRALTRPLARQVRVGLLLPGQHWADVSVPSPYGPSLRFRTSLWLRPGFDNSYVLVMRRSGPQLQPLAPGGTPGPGYGGPAYGGQYPAPGPYGNQGDYGYNQGQPTPSYPNGGTYPNLPAPSYPNNTPHYPSGNGTGSGGSYPAPNSGHPATPGSNYPATPGNSYPAPGSGYPAAPGSGYPTTPGNSYPAPGSGYPTAPSPGYPAPGTGYPTAPGNGYPAPGSGYPTAPGNGGYSSNSAGYQAPLSPADFGGLQQELAQHPFDGDKLSILKQALSESTVRADELAVLIRKLDFDKSRIELAEFGYAHVADQQNFYRVYDALQYPSSIREVQQALGLPQR